MSWEPITEAPKDGSLLDLYTANGYRYTDCFYDPDRNLWVHRIRYIQKNMKRITKFQQVINPTHYMPLPAPPQ